MEHKIDFHPLRPLHFPLLTKWLMEPHVKPFYDPGIIWTEDLVYQKFTPYAEGFKTADGIRKPIHAFIFHLEDLPIGYIQYYNAYDFPRHGYQLQEKLSHSQVEDGSLASMDLFIGDKEWIGKGIGPMVIQKFLQEKIHQDFGTCVVDPNHEQAIRCFTKAGFVKGPSPLMFCHKTKKVPIFIRTGVYGIAISDQKILVIQQNHGAHKGKFDLPGGGIDPGETIESALQREFFEEVGMQFDSMTHLCNLSAITDHLDHPTKLQQIGLIYRVEGLRRLENPSVEFAPEWIEIDRLKSLKLTPFLQDVLQKHRMHSL